MLNFIMKIDSSGTLWKTSELKNLEVMFLSLSVPVRIDRSSLGKVASSCGPPDVAEP
jgi:hypothetical protein